MPYMSVTLDVSKLSGWLNADAPCRDERRVCDAMREVWAERQGGQGAAAGPRARADPEHVAHVRDARRVPAGNVHVKVLQVIEEVAHVGDARDVPVGDGAVRRNSGCRVSVDRLDRRLQRGRAREGDGGAGDDEGGGGIGDDEGGGGDGNDEGGGGDGDDEGGDGDGGGGGGEGGGDGVSKGGEGDGGLELGGEDGGGGGLGNGGEGEGGGGLGEGGGEGDGGEAGGGDGNAVVASVRRGGESHASVLVVEEGGARDVLGRVVAPLRPVAAADNADRPAMQSGRGAALLLRELLIRPWVPEQLKAVKYNGAAALVVDAKAHPHAGAMRDSVLP
eukprot:scaffold13486_cov55-Phaeocystis_antarctica.AAC.4